VTMPDEYVADRRRSGSFCADVATLFIPPLTRTSGARHFSYFWSLVTGRWSLVTGHWSLVTVFRPDKSRQLASLPDDIVRTMIDCATLRRPENATELRAHGPAHDLQLEDCDNGIDRVLFARSEPCHCALCFLE